MTQYSEEDLLALSGIQHFAYCQRQWALIHIERQWQENLLTAQGRQLHKRVDDPGFFEARGGVLTARSVPIVSYKLGLFGVADMIEFLSDNDNRANVTLVNREGLWRPIPIEYKRGKPKKTKVDEVQLCAQGICLEEMLCSEISYGYIFYGETKRRIKVQFDDRLREMVKVISNKMHQLQDRRETPKTTKKHQNCKNCSLVNLCVPKLGNKKVSVNNYINKYLEE